MCDNTQTSYKQRASNLYRMQPRQTKPYLMFAYYVQRSLKGLQLSPASHFLFPLVLSLSLCYNHSFLLPDRSNPRFPPPPSRLTKSTWPNKLAFYSTMSASPPPLPMHKETRYLLNDESIIYGNQCYCEIWEEDSQLFQQDATVAKFKFSSLDI